MKRFLFTLCAIFAIGFSNSQNPYNISEIEQIGLRLTTKTDKNKTLYLDAETYEYISKKEFIQKYGKNVAKKLGSIQKSRDKEELLRAKQEAIAKMQAEAIAEILQIETYESVSYNNNYYADLLDRLDGEYDNIINYKNAAIFFRDNIAGIDKNGNISIVSIIDAPECSSEQIYIQANSWFLNTFNSAKDVIQFNDKNSGVIFAKGYLKNIADHIGFEAHYKVSAYVIFRIDIKDNRVRLITTIQEYESVSIGGVLSVILVGINPVLSKYKPSSVFPFVEGMSVISDTAGAKAYCACCMYMIALKNQLARAITQGIIGADTESW